MDEKRGAASEPGGWTIAFTLVIVVLVIGALVLSFVLSS
jgi:hypothetical protein